MQAKGSINRATVNTFVMGKTMKSDFLNWASALFVIGVLVTGGAQLLKTDATKTNLSSTQNNSAQVAGIISSKATAN